MQISLNRVRVASDTQGIVDIETVEPGRTECLRNGQCNFGAGYRPRFSCEPTGVPKDRASLYENVVWEFVTDETKVLRFTIEDPDGDGEYEWIGRGKGPFHGGNHMLGQRTHGNDLVAVVTHGAGDSFTVQCFRDGVGSNILGPYKLAA